MNEPITVVTLGFIAVIFLGAILIVYLLFDNVSLRKRIDALQDKNIEQEAKIKAQETEIALLKMVLTTYLEKEKEVSRDRERTEMLTQVLRELRGVSREVNVINAGDGASFGQAAAGSGATQVQGQ